MSRRRVVFLVLPGSQLLDLAGPAEVFAAASTLLEQRRGDRSYSVTLVSGEARVETATGVALETKPIAQFRGAIDTLIVPGGIDFAERDFEPDALRWLTRAAPRARRVVSICTGAFVLAKLGLLAGRRATTHWATLEALSRAAPSCRVETDALYVKDGALYTSAGVSAGLDLALALVAEDHDHELARAVARALVMFLHRPGGQSQFSEALRAPSSAHSGIQAAQAEVVAAPEADHCVDTLARRAGMSPRHFVRVFVAQTGESPARYVQRIRLERARQLLEATEESIDRVAEHCGFGTPETMRRTFQRNLGTSPAAYRSRFANA
jgi:transcriptional regulator GlxA family with amidase domain